MEATLSRKKSLPSPAARVGQGVGHGSGNGGRARRTQEVRGPAGGGSGCSRWGAWKASRGLTVDVVARLFFRVPYFVASQAPVMVVTVLESPDRVC